MWTIRWWPVVGGASRHSCSKDRSSFSPKGYKNDRHLMEVEKYEKRENNTNPGLKCFDVVFNILLVGFI